MNARLDIEGRSQVGDDAPLAHSDGLVLKLLELERLGALRCELLISLGERA